MTRSELFPLFNPTDLLPGLVESMTLDEKFYETLKPTPEQKAMLKEKGRFLQENRRAYVALSRKYPIESAERDDPDIAAQFSALNREFVVVGHQANDELAATITAEQRSALLMN